ncbi:biotin--[acetyl-CoA-carboxylase] ligase, partial [Streptomyces sp. SID10244]|nr:biotin--[acetyl-CoA-carboxylase] ligase [Streptomyces sp. SID10244]
VGTAVGIDRTGRIVIDVDGREVVAAAGDVTHLRPID